jgi:oligopeptide/dipeptide ABC transporter ATP-binding protein
MYAFEFVECGLTKDILNNASHPYTRALLKAVPNISSDFRTMSPIPGSSPDPVNIPSGCSYHPRCPMADEQCREVDPGFHDVADKHEAACFYWENAAAEIPIPESNGTRLEDMEENNGD